MNNHKIALQISFFILLFCSLIAPAALAQAPNVETPGQGIYPAPVIGGDALPPPLAPSGISSTSNSSIFPVAPEQIPFTIYLRTKTYSHNTHQYTGNKTVLTIRTNNLNAMQMDLIAGILQIDPNTALTNNEHPMWLDVSEAQLEQIQNVLIPTSHSRQMLQNTSLFHYLPTARHLSHWAVLLGVVFATIMLAIAAYGMIMSHRGSADKIISTISGLIVLLMAYTIYNLLIANASNSQSSTIAAVNPANSSQSSGAMP